MTGEPRGAIWIKSFITVALFAWGLASAQSRPAKPPYPASPIRPGPAWFVNVAPEAGLTMQNVNGDADMKKYIIETTGSGVAIIDYDRDGWPDIFLLNGRLLEEKMTPGAEPTSHLYHNNHDGTFKDVTLRDFLR
jgi:hypothetical protein